jgi:hypothetical protein
MQLAGRPWIAAGVALVSPVTPAFRASPKGRAVGHCPKVTVQ